MHISGAEKLGLIRRPFLANESDSLDLQEFVTAMLPLLPKSRSRGRFARPTSPSPCSGLRYPVSGLLASHLSGLLSCHFLLLAQLLLLVRGSCSLVRPPTHPPAHSLPLAFDGSDMVRDGVVFVLLNLQTQSN